MDGREQPAGGLFVLPYMRRPLQQTHITESYVSSPPALIVIDECGDVFTLGLQYQDMRDAPQGEFAFTILCNGRWTGEYGSRIERRNNRVRIFCRGGYWKIWNGKQFL